MANEAIRMTPCPDEVLMLPFVLIVMELREEERRKIGRSGRDED